MTAPDQDPTQAFYYNAKDKPAQPELRQVLTTTSQALRAAVWAVPGIIEAEAALHRFDGFRSHVLEHARGPEVRSIADELAGAITVGDVLTPEVFQSALIDLHQREQIIAMAGNIIDVIGSKLWDNRTRLIAAAEATIVRHLQRQLDAVVETVRQLDVTAADLDPAAAIAADRVNEHQASLGAIDVYVDITKGVRDWHSAHHVGAGDPHYWTKALLRDPLHLDPLLGVALADCFAFNPATGERYDGDTKWPDLEDAGLTLVWLAQQLKPTGHISTIREFQTHTAALRQAISDARGAANGATRMRVVRDGRLIKRLFEQVPEASRRTVTVSNHDAETDDDWQVRFRETAISE